MLARDVSVNIIAFHLDEAILMGYTMIDKIITLGYF